MKALDLRFRAHHGPPGYATDCTCMYMYRPNHDCNRHLIDADLFLINDLTIEITDISFLIVATELHFKVTIDSHQLNVNRSAYYSSYQGVYT